MYELQKRLLSNFNKCSFQAFVEFLLKNSYPEHDKDYSPETKLRSPLPYFLKRQTGGRFESYEHLYLTNFYFYNKDVIRTKFISPELKRSIRNAFKTFPRIEGPNLIQVGNFYLMTNLFDFNKNDYDYFFEKFKPWAKKVVPYYQTFGIGSIDTFFEQKPKEISSYLGKFYKSSFDGIALSISKDGLFAQPYYSENLISTGVLRNSKIPLEGIVITNLVNEYHILKEFTKVINEGVERKIEEFIAAHYKFILGSQYDRIESQIWMKIPDVDVGGKNRRLDLFIRNSLSNDWELFELKTDLKIVTNTRSVPQFTKAIYSAISQARNYLRILETDRMKQRLMSEGVDYFEPTINIIMGRKPQISDKEWRWLLKNNVGINLITFDGIESELKLKLKDKLQFLKTINEQ